MSASVSIFNYVCLSLVLYLTLNGQNIAIQGASNGSPLQACVDMVPDHHVDAQTSASPFVATPSVTSTTNGTDVKLTLATKSGSDLTFKGFLVIAFNHANQTEGPIGTFSSVSDGQTINCPGVSANNAATHINSANKTSVTMDWTAPEGFVGTVLFKTTFAQNGGVFWVATPSSLVNFV
uniref:Reelin domain-containing protein n=1 Tax=Daphnia galeata TaxID=27404 RepID=A0A8J2RDD2_9CRUS|nr:unnamed protein product [Daphnia galeata]